jgi:hypothetical protein
VHTCTRLVIVDRLVSRVRFLRFALCSRLLLLIFFAATSIILSKKNDAFSSKELTLERIRTELLQKQYSTIHQGAAYQGYIPSPVEMFKKNVFSSARMSRVCGNELFKKMQTNLKEMYFYSRCTSFWTPRSVLVKSPGCFLRTKIPVPALPSFRPNQSANDRIGPCEKEIVFELQKNMDEKFLDPNA